MKTFYIIAPLATLLLALVSYFGLTQEKPSEVKTRPVRTISVITSEVEQHNISPSISLVGKLNADRSVIIAPEVTGKIKKISVSANQKVTAGQLLIQLDDSKAKAAQAEAQAYLNDEQRKLRDYERLGPQNAITQTELDSQRASVEIAKARLAAVTADLNDHYLSAPFSGTTGLIDFSLGKMVSSGNELLSLDDLSTMRIDLQVPEQYLSLLSVGMAISATSQAWPGDIFTGTITALDSRVNQETLNLRVRAHFDNASLKLKPGMMLSANIEFPTTSEPLIPVQALEYSGTKRFVYVIDDANKANRTLVTLGQRIDNQVVIADGLKVGDKIVTQGLVNMRDGILINNLSENREMPVTAQQASH